MSIQMSTDNNDRNKYLKFYHIQNFELFKKSYFPNPEINIIKSYIKFFSLHGTD